MRPAWEPKYSFIFNVFPAKHATCRVATKPSRTCEFTYPYRNFRNRGDWVPTSFPPNCFAKCRAKAARQRRRRDARGQRERRVRERWRNQAGTRMVQVLERRGAVLLAMETELGSTPQPLRRPRAWDYRSVEIYTMLVSSI